MTVYVAILHDHLCDYFGAMTSILGVFPDMKTAEAACAPFRGENFTVRFVDYELGRLETDMTPGLHSIT